MEMAVIDDSGNLARPFVVDGQQVGEVRLHPALQEMETVNKWKSSGSPPGWKARSVETPLEPVAARLVRLPATKTWIPSPVRNAFPRDTLDVRKGRCQTLGITWPWLQAGAMFGFGLDAAVVL